ncbi:hypothetical protein FOC27_04975 [Burkholderia multivorans]|nr:hypothetical protein FOC27_04975 [Burkholderia multivorans]QGR87409.1 hypothetical protein FOC34_19600 [Burkholderia multivorans]
MGHVLPDEWPAHGPGEAGRAPRDGMPGRVLADGGRPDGDPRVLNGT